MKSIIIVLGLLLTQLSFAKPGPEIPTPIISYQDAHNLAIKELLTSKHNIDPIYAPAKEYIVFSISYTQQNNKWLWIVKFIHPRANDHQVIYHVSQTGGVTLHVATE